jgi:hypothetical protein
MAVLQVLPKGDGCSLVMGVWLPRAGELVTVSCPRAPSSMPNAYTYAPHMCTTQCNWVLACIIECAWSAHIHAMCPMHNGKRDFGA